MLPLIIYPYAYLPWFFVTGGIGSMASDSDFVVGIALVLAGLYQIVVLVNAVWGTVSVARKPYTAKEAAKLNLVVKAWQIPAYVFHFLLGLVGCLMSVWGMGFILFAIIVDLLTIALTGIFAIGCMVKLKKQNVLTTPLAILAGIGSFIYCVDIIVAIVLVCMCKKAEKQQTMPSV